MQWPLNIAACVLVVVHSKHIVRWRRDLVGMSVTVDGW